MAEETTNQYLPDRVAPPGETLQELIEEHGMTQAELASRMGRPRKTINEIIQAKAAITPETALQLENVFGVEASFWNNLERNYREHLARREEEERLSSYVSWLDELPIGELVRQRLIPARRPREMRVKDCLGFFGVSSPEQWRRVYLAPQAAFRQSSSFEINPGAVASWLRAGELSAQRVTTEPYDAERFRHALEEIRRLVVEPDPAVFQPAVEGSFATCGVVLVFVSGVRGCRASGATRWLSPDKALIQLSLRYGSDDHLWFTIFHEACHVLRHGKREVFLEGQDGSNDVPDMEAEANQFAADLLIPPAEYKKFREAAEFDAQAIRSFARRIAVSPGIVVGRLQHDVILGYGTPLNRLKKRFKLVAAPQ